MTKSKDMGEVKNKILTLVEEYSDLKFAEEEKEYISPSGKVIDKDDLVNLVDACLDGWLTEGRYAKQLEIEISKKVGQKHTLLVNSGSSANLLALSALTSYLLGDRQLKPGDEVITVAAGFPTTIAPIIQNRLVPVFVDVDIRTINVKAEEVEKAISEKTKAIMIAHTFGQSL